MKLLRCKARLIIQSNEQIARINYFNTFISVLYYATLYIICIKAAANDWEMDHVDINIIFLNLTVKEELFIELLQFIKEVFFKFKNNKGPAYIKLNKALYRLKQTFKEWLKIVVNFF
jgi:hypothetical protein